MTLSILKLLFNKSKSETDIRFSAGLLISGTRDAVATSSLCGYSAAVATISTVGSINFINFEKTKKKTRFLVTR